MSAERSVGGIGPDDRGQSTVEFALVLPLLMLVVLAAAQVGLVVLTKFSTIHTAREVARAVSLDPTVDVDTVGEMASPVGADVTVTLRWLDSSIANTRIVEVTVAQHAPALFGTLVPAVDVSATVAMLAE